MKPKWYAILILAAIVAASTITISIGNKDTAPGQETDKCSNDNQCQDDQSCVDGTCKSLEGSCEVVNEQQSVDESASGNPENDPGQDESTPPTERVQEKESVPGNSESANGQDKLTPPGQRKDTHDCSLNSDCQSGQICVDGTCQGEVVEEQQPASVQEQSALGNSESVPGQKESTPPGNSEVTASGECDCGNGQVCCGSNTDKPGRCVGDENACYTGPNAGDEGQCGNDEQCDDSNPCTYDICVSNTRPGHCLNARMPLGTQCPDGYCDRSGNCVSHGLGCSPGWDDCDGNGDCECPGACDSSGNCAAIVPTTCKEIGENCDPNNNNCCFGRCEYMPPGAYWCIGECWPNRGACYSNDVCCSNICYGGECKGW